MPHKTTRSTSTPNASQDGEEKQQQDIRSLVEMMKEMMGGIQMMMKNSEKRFDQMDQIMTNRLYTLEEKVESLQNDNNKLKNQIQSLKQETGRQVALKWMERDEELTTIHVTGLDVERGDDKTNKEAASKFIKMNLKLDNIDPEGAFTTVMRNGKNKLKIKLRNKEDKRRLLANGAKLKDTPLRMEAAHLPMVGEAIFQLKQLAYSHRQQGKKATYSRAGVYINGNYCTDVIEQMAKNHLANLNLL